MNGKTPKNESRQPRPLPQTVFIVKNLTMAARGTVRTEYGSAVANNICGLACFRTAKAALAFSKTMPTSGNLIWKVARDEAREAAQDAGSLIALILGDDPENPEIHFLRGCESV